MNILLDKNPIIEYVRYKVFNENIGFTKKHSIILIQGIKSEKIQICMGSWTVFAVHNYILYKAQKPKEDNGLGLDKDKAKERAKQFIKYFINHDNVNILGINKAEIITSINSTAHHFEDACQAEYMKLFGCTNIITWDKDFIDSGGINPKQFLQKKYPEMLNISIE